MNWTQFAINLAAAFALGSLIGAERQWRQRMAGLRTNALVAIGAAMFVMLAMPTPDNTMRVAAQVVSAAQRKFLPPGGFASGKVEVRANIHCHGRQHAMLETSSDA